MALLVKSLNQRQKQKMSLNPDDQAVDADKDSTITHLREENEDLRRQIEELSTRLSLYEPEQGPSTRRNHEGGSSSAAASSGGGNVGRKSIPFPNRSAKQHQGRMAYLLKKLEMQHTWTQDSIADLQAYFVSTDIPGAGNEFFRLAVVAFAGENGLQTITDIDTFLAML